MKIFDCLCSVMIADDMLVLDVLNSLVNAPSKMTKLEINIPSGQLLSLLVVPFFSPHYMLAMLIISYVSLLLMY
jgi:hypothetical protein